MSEGKRVALGEFCLFFFQIGQTVSPQSVLTTNLEVKNGVNCEHSPVDLSKVSRDVGSWRTGLRIPPVEPRV